MPVAVRLSSRKRTRSRSDDSVRRVAGPRRATEFVLTLHNTFVYRTKARRRAVLDVFRALRPGVAVCVELDRALSFRSAGEHACELKHMWDGRFSTEEVLFWIDYLRQKRVRVLATLDFKPDALRHGRALAKKVREDDACFVWWKAQLLRRGVRVRCATDPRCVPSRDVKTLKATDRLSALPAFSPYLKVHGFTRRTQFDAWRAAVDGRCAYALLAVDAGTPVAEHALRTVHADALTPASASVSQSRV
jgi:hypothetical protein